MYNNFPITTTLNIVDNEYLNLKLKGVKEIYNSGVNLDLFYLLISNMRNGLTRSHERNEFNIEEWIGFFGDHFHPIIVNSDQLIFLFDYLTQTINGVLGFNGTEYFTVHNNEIDFNNKFTIEIIIFRTLEGQ